MIDKMMVLGENLVKLNLRTMITVQYQLLIGHFLKFCFDVVTAIGHSVFLYHSAYN